MNCVVRSAIRPGRLPTTPANLRLARSVSTPSEPNDPPTAQTSTDQVPSPPAPPSSSTPPPSTQPSARLKSPYVNAERWAAERAQLVARVHKTRLEAERRWTAWLSTAQATAKERYAQLELERKIKEAGARINQATGYEEIDRLRVRVGGHGKST